jgi:hypothetical protein
MITPQTFGMIHILLINKGLCKEKNRINDHFNHLSGLVPSAGVEPAHPKILVFETNASTNSASWASCFLFDSANIVFTLTLPKKKVVLYLNYLIMSLKILIKSIWKMKSQLLSWLF